MSVTFNDLWKAFPKGKSAAEVYKMVGGEIYELFEEDPESYANACALRMSIAFNKGGLVILSGDEDPGSRYKGKTLSSETLPGSGRKYYAYYLRVKDVIKFIEKRFGKPTLTFTQNSKPKVTEAKDKLKGKKGIVVFKIAFSDATGHVALWNRFVFADVSDDYFKDPRLHELSFWKLT